MYLTVSGILRFLAPRHRFWTLFSGRKTPKSRSFWQFLLVRICGGICAVMGVNWLVQLHPEILSTKQPLYDPIIHHWHSLDEDGTDEETAILQRLEKTMQFHLRPNERISVPFGICIGAIHGERTFLFSAGLITSTSKTSPDANTVFGLGSVTKVFTATALARSLENGTTSLDQTLSSLLPDWKMNEQNASITVKDLITHHSGLPKNVKLPLTTFAESVIRLGPYSDDLTIDDAKNSLAVFPASGREYRYSNFGVAILGYALAHGRGETYDAMINNLICNPLNMSDTSVTPAKETTRTAEGYVGPIRFAGRYLLMRLPCHELAEVYQGGFGLYSTVNDLLRYVNASLRAPVGPIGAALSQIQVPVANTNRDENKAGLSLMIKHVSWAHDPLYWHSGYDGGFTAYIAFFKERKIGLVLLASGFVSEELPDKLMKALYSSTVP